MDRTELAWAAGFWDGEGSAYLVGEAGRATKQPHARVNQSSVDGPPEVLRRFQRAVGFGPLMGPDFMDGRQPLYRWEVSRRSDVERLAALLAPWIGEVKRKQFGKVTETDVVPSQWSTASVDERSAWAAGLWDGEGSLCLLKHRSHEGHFVPEAAITQASADGLPEVLMRMASIGPTGFIYGPFERKGSSDPVYRWKVFRLEQIQELMKRIKPWLGLVKIKQADRVFEVLAQQPRLPRGNPAWGSHKTHCARGHAYEGARLRPFRSRGKRAEAPRESSRCLACLREYAAEQRKNKGGSLRRRPQTRFPK